MSRNTVYLAVILVWFCLCVPEASARGPDIGDIHPGDTIFVYEQGLDLTRLAVDGSSVAWLVHYTSQVSGSFDNRVPVTDPRSFDLLAEFVDDTYGAYYAWNRSGLIEGEPYVMVQAPEVAIEPVLASDHTQSIRDISVPMGTSIAFRISSPAVGTEYHVGSTYPASVNIMITLPGGAQTTSFGGSNLKGIHIDAPVIYTDNVRSATLLDRLNSGDYSARAEWNTPQAFADYAPGSDPIDFTVKERAAFTTTSTPTATTAPTTPPVPSPTGTLPTGTSPSPTTPALPPTAPVTAATPTPEASGFGVIIAACACALAVLLRQ